MPNFYSFLTTALGTVALVFAVVLPAVAQSPAVSPTEPITPRPLQPLRPIVPTAPPPAVSSPQSIPSTSQPIVPQPTSPQPIVPQPTTPQLTVPTPLQPIVPATAEVRLVLKLRERRVYLYQGEQVKFSYPVAIGRAGWETPTGKFEVMQMIEHPGWTSPFTGEQLPPGAENPLGDRWIGFWTDGMNSIGFHGTPNRESIGQAASHGCVRMLNEDIRTLYDLVQVGTPVTVEP